MPCHGRAARNCSRTAATRKCSSQPPSHGASESRRGAGHHGDSLIGVRNAMIDALDGDVMNGGEQKVSLCLGPPKDVPIPQFLEHCGG